MRSFTASLFGLALTSLIAAPLSAQSIDFTVSDVVLVQVFQNGNTELIAERPMQLRVGVDVQNQTNPVKKIDAFVRVFVDGVEAADSPIFSNNGPFNATGNFQPNLGASSLNFTYIPPLSNDVVFQVEINPPGPNFVPEADTGNNSFSTAPQQFRNQDRLELAYAPIDLRPGGGGTPNLPNNNLIKPGVGDNFVQGILPTGSIEYRRIDAPSKLWTGSVQGTGSSLNSSLTNDLFLMSPQPDFIYGWVPGSLPYNGQAFLNGKASMGNTESIRHQRTYAHELGHNFGLGHNGENNGNFGLDVEQHLWLTEGLGKQKADSLNDIMVAGQLTNTAWVSPNTFNFIKGQPEFTPSPAPTPGDEDPPVDRVLIGGIWNQETGTIALNPVLEVPRTTRGSEPAALGTRDLLVRAYAGERLVREFPLSARSTGDACVDETQHSDNDAHIEADPNVGFAALIPARGLDGARYERLELVSLGAQAQPVTLTRSAHAPEVRFLTPRAKEPLGAQVEVSWEASDADGDELFSTLRFIPDGDDHIVPLVVHSTETSHHVDLSRLPDFRAGAGYFELLVTDGLRTTRARSAPLEGSGAFAGAGGNPPFVEIYHPDDGFQFRKGMNVILHSSGWDLEDHRLDGMSIEWNSDVDGVLGHGRRFTYTDLSVGPHVITVTATDSGGQMTSRSNAIMINDRDLPETEPVFCATDLGFGGPGSAQLSLCGGDLTSGGTAELLLTDAPALTPAFFVVGLNNSPVFVKGGTVVPFPYTSLLTRMTDAAGEISNSGITSPGIPLTIYVQYAIVDGSQPAGFGFSNALEVEF